MTMPKDNISILIPTHNDVCAQLVADLKAQADKLTGREGHPLRYEIIVADDGSTDLQAVEANSSIDRWDHCRYIRRKENVGRARIRNFLVQQSQGDYLLFIDSDLFVNDSHYLANYLQADSDEVIYGGTRIGGDADRLKGNLRYRYEKAAEAAHRAAVRALRPGRELSVCNTMLRRDIALAHPFDSRIKAYGYEDVLLGKSITESGITISHIENPMRIERFETNAEFVRKTEDALRTLDAFDKELKGFSNIGNSVERLGRFLPLSLFTAWHRLAGNAEKRWLSGPHPNLLVFKLYKLGFYLTLRQRRRKD